jgi:hypothetical protein
MSDLNIILAAAALIGPVIVYIAAKRDMDYMISPEEAAAQDRVVHQYYQLNEAGRKLKQETIERRNSARARVKAKREKQE